MAEASGCFALTAIVCRGLSCRTRSTRAARFFRPMDAGWGYVSDQSGRNEVYIQPFTGPGAEWAASTEGGTEPCGHVTDVKLFIVPAAR